MIDYAAARAVAMVVRLGSFEAAARALGVTPSAVSQRVRQLEERLGTVLIMRGTPCVATDKGARLCRHMDHVGLLEQDLHDHLPGLGAAPQVTIPIATNADSLGTWFMPALAAHARTGGHLLSIALDDEDHTADWLRRGQVLAAVTAVAQPVHGCSVTPLGALRYVATASPAYVHRHFPEGVTAAALARAPALTFNQKDSLQQDWVRQGFGEGIVLPTHWLPSTQAFVEASLAGMGWALIPVQLARAHLDAGRLVELAPCRWLDRALFWQVSRLAARSLSALTQAVVAAARQDLVRPG
ncbi:LysR family transcriptional regulator ArgP [Plastorhodobacter daqingensis]|uniref:LysR family transcriptional regulator ArgP n=1 Tax=Plastorhodobacter daqingensis TaxID=1387281 RepID=A0ABW2ULS0_9RHOB